MTGNQYDLEMNYFIIRSLSSEKMGYNELFRFVTSKYKKNVSPDTFDYHIKHLRESGMIHKTKRFEPFTLTEECEHRLQLEMLDLFSPVPNVRKRALSTASKQVALRQIDVYILLLLFKYDLTYRFEKEEELENLLSVFGLSTNSLTIKLFIDNELTYLKKLESNDSKISVQKRRDISGAISFICYIKGVKYPLSRYRSDPFRKMGITQDEIINALSLLSNEGIVQKPIVYSDDSIYLATDIHLYDLLSELDFCYGVSRSTLKKLWKLRKPTPEETHWLQRIEGDSEVTKSIERSQNYRKKTGRTYYSRKKLIRKIIEEIRTDIKEMKERIEKEYQETLSDQQYYFIIREIEKFAFPNWLERIRTRLH